jgi:hypothetical protein
MIKSYEMMEFKSTSQDKDTKDQQVSEKNSNEPVLKAYLRDKFGMRLDNLIFFTKCHLIEDQNKEGGHNYKLNEHIFVLKNEFIITNTYIDEHKMTEYKICMEENAISNLNLEKGKNIKMDNDISISSTNFNLNSFFSSFKNAKIIKKDLKNVNNLF